MQLALTSSTFKRNIVREILVPERGVQPKNSRVKTDRSADKDGRSWLSAVLGCGMGILMQARFVDLQCCSS